MINKRVKKSNDYYVSVVSMGNVGKKPFSISSRKLKALVVSAACIIVGMMVFLVIAFVNMGDLRQKVETDGQMISQYRAGLEKAQNENTTLMERLEQALNDLAEVSAVRDENEAAAQVNVGQEQDAAGSNENTQGADILQGRLGVGSVAMGMSSLLPKNAEVELLNWFGPGAKIFPRGTKALVIDAETGLSFRVQRFGGDFHADSYPLTKEDTAVMKRIYGGEWSWDRRAIFVVIGERVIAASMNGMPHMVDANTKDDFLGHFCIHFYKSKVHENGKECPVHQKMVKKAYDIGQQFAKKQL